MNEEIGARGGKNDRRRVIKIQNNKLKRLKEEELEELERDVRKKQITNLITLIPLTIIGQTLKIFDNKKEKIEEQVELLEDPKQVEPQKEEPSSNKKTIIIFKKKEKVKPQEEIEEVEEVEELKEEVETQKKEVITSSSTTSPKKEVIEQTSEAPVPIIPIPLPPEEEVIETLADNNEILDNLKQKEIIDVYHKELKSIRSDLRHLIFDYNIMVDESEDLYTSKEAEQLLDSLNLLINKIEELKRKIKVEDLDKYDENYIYTLIENYLEEFRNKKVIKNIKDSDLFIEISDKLDELSSKKDKLKDKVEKRKEETKAKEDKYQEIKEKYYSIDAFNDQMYALQKEQEALLKRVQEEVSKAVTVEEKVKTEINYFDTGAKNLLKLFALEMFIPGARGAKRIVTATALYAYYMNKLLNPKVITKKYKEIKVIDYEDAIERNINDLEKLENSLSKTTSQIDKIINKFKEEYSEYMDTIPEYTSFLNKLYKVKDNLKEKEDELSYIKSEQKKQLEINKVQVKKRGTYEM